MAFHGFPEPDWRAFRELREVALERFCKRTLDDLESFRVDESRSHHERDAELAQAFNDPRRSRMIPQLAAIHAYGLLEPEELARFTSETRSTIEDLARDVIR
jgi:hypothetical protein